MPLRNWEVGNIEKNVHLQNQLVEQFGASGRKAMMSKKKEYSKEEMNFALAVVEVSPRFWTEYFMRI